MLMFSSRGLIGTLPILLALMFILSGCVREEDENTKPSMLHWIEDATGTMTLDEILTKELSTEWSLASNHNFNLGFIDSAIWLSLPFENNKNVRISMLLEIAFPLHDSINIYLLDGNEIVNSYQTGDHLPFTERPIKHRNFLFPYSVGANKKLQAIVRIQTTDAMYFPIKVWEGGEFFNHDQNEILLLGGFFGFLSIMLIYNLFIYLVTREKNYLYYSLFIFSTLYFQITQKNLGFQYLWPDEVFFNQVSVPTSIFLMLATSSFFILQFLKLNKKQYAKTVIAFRVITWLALIGAIGGAIIFSILYSDTFYRLFVQISAAFAIFSAVLSMLMLVNISFQGDRSAQILSIAWLFLLAGSIAFALGRLGAPIPMILAENGMLIGSIFEAALISLALARHIRIERETRVFAQALALKNERKASKAQRSLLILQKKTTQQLEKEVKERTYKLESAMQDLTKANQTLDGLSRLDSLTGLSNRRNFDQEFNVSWLSCTRSQRPISLLMADIDHFKIINDTYGHLFGDLCLIRVSNILTKYISRPGDLVARFGGEEFIIMLPNTDALGAFLIAETVRKAIENIKINHEKKQVKFTISIGVATVIPSPSTNFLNLNKSADQALYLAKEGGRNKTISFEASPIKLAGSELC